VRFLVVLVLVVASGVAGASWFRDGSAAPGVVALSLLLLAMLVIAGGRKKARLRREAAAAVADPEEQVVSSGVPALASQANSEEVIVVDPEAIGDDGPEPGTPSAGTPDCEVVAEMPAEMPADAGQEAPTDAETASIPSVRTPFSVQPAVVLMSLYDAVAERYDTLCAHLWLEDRPTSTLRLVAAFGPRVPGGDPVTLEDRILGVCAATRTAVFTPLESSRGPEGPERVWRYAVPIGTPEVRGVAAVDIVVPDPASVAVVLNEVSSVLRGSLTAALAVHVARAEMDTAVLLLQAVQELTSGMDGDEVLVSALERAMEVAGASTGSVMVPDGADGALRIVASRGLPSDVVSSTCVEGGEGIAGTVYSTSSSMLIEDLPGRGGARRHGVLSSVSIPIADSKGSYGVINVGARAFPARLTDAYVRALGILGAQTAVAIRSSRAEEHSWELYLENLQALATALESEDPFRRGASLRTATLSVALGDELGLDSDELVSLHVAAILHDVGMGLATGSVGSVDRPLSTVDRGLVRAHPKVGADVLAQVPSLERHAPAVRHHHERYDGDGYDLGLAGAAIPLGSRILAVTDSFVAMTSPRPYRDALSVADALAELDSEAGRQFDPMIVEAFISMLGRRPELAG